MGACATKPLTNEGDVPAPEPALETLLVIEAANEVETEKDEKKAEDNDADGVGQSLGSLLDEHKEENKVEAQKNEGKVEEVSTSEPEKPETIVIKPDIHAEDEPATVVEAKEDKEAEKSDE